MFILAMPRFQSRTVVQSSDKDQDDGRRARSRAICFERKSIEIPAVTSKI